MHSLLTILLSLLFFLNKPLKSLADQGDDFLKVCPPSTCGSGSGSPQIRFPLRLRSAPPSCGLAGLDLTCSGNDTLLSIPSLPPFKITNINYGTGELTLDLGSWFGAGSGPCPLLNLTSLVASLVANLTTSEYRLETEPVSWVRCSSKFVPCSGPNCGEIAGPVPSCFVDKGYFVYVVFEYAHIDVLPHDCEVFQTGGEIPYFEVTPFWVDGDATLNYWGYENCRECERGGRQCGFNFARNQSFCIDQQHHGENT